MIETRIHHNLRISLSLTEQFKDNERERKYQKLTKDILMYEFYSLKNEKVSPVCPFFRQYLNRPIVMKGILFFCHVILG